MHGTTVKRRRKNKSVFTCFVWISEQK